MWQHTLFLLATTISTISITFAFEYDFAALALNISQAAYCMPETAIDSKSWNCATCSPNVMFETSYAGHGELVLFGYIPERDSLFLAYRGSTNIQNWIDNVQVRQESPYQDTEIGVEHGMYSLYASLRDNITVMLNHMVTKYNTKRLVVTGHSLGGALGTLTVFDMMYTNSPFMVTDLITFGAPRVGNERFTQYFERFELHVSRVTHYYDMVPHVPETFLGYKHIRDEVWFNEPSTSYIECSDGEDLNCSDSCSPIHCTSTSDHMTYMKIPMGTEGLC